MKGKSNKKKYLHDWYLKNKKIQNEKMRLQYQENRDRFIQLRLKRYRENKDQEKNYMQAWRKENRPKCNRLGSAYKCSKKNATPKWLTKEMIIEMEGYYREARRLTIKTGIPHEVDHVIPIRGKNVCGLNVPWNLRVITSKENHQKNNRLLEAV